MGNWQTSIPNFDDPLANPGTRYGSGHIEAENGHNDAQNVARVFDIVVSNVVDSTQYNILVDGATISFTSGVGTTATLIRDGLSAAVTAFAAANPNSGAAFLALSTPAADTLRLTESAPATRQVTVAEGDANLTGTEITAHSNEEPLDAGVGVFRGPSQGSIRASGLAAAFLGIVEHRERGVELERETTEFLYESGSQVPVGLRGPYVVRTDAGHTMAVGDSVFCRVTVGPNGAVLGYFRNDNDGGNAIAVPNSRVVRGGTGKAVIAINQP